jgi:hypothetical protein
MEYVSENGEPHVKWNKPNSERQILDILPHKWNLEASFKNEKNDMNAKGGLFRRLRGKGKEVSDEDGYEH